MKLNGIYYALFSDEFTRLIGGSDEVKREVLFAQEAESDDRDCWLPAATSSAVVSVYSTVAGQRNNIFICAHATINNSRPSPLDKDSVVNYVRVKSKLKVPRCVAVNINHCLCFPFVFVGKLSGSGNCWKSRGAWVSAAVTRSAIYRRCIWFMS